MNTRRMVSIRLEEGRENEDIPPLVEKVDKGSNGDQFHIMGGSNDIPLDPPVNE